MTTMAKLNKMNEDCKGCECYTCKLQDNDVCCGVYWDCENLSEKGTVCNMSK